MQLRWIFGIVVLMPLAVVAGVVPSPDPLGGQQLTLFQDLERADQTDSKKALEISFQLQKLAPASTDNEAWSSLLYSYYLLENDSIGKAIELLSDSLNNNWQELSSETKAFHTYCLAYANIYQGNYIVAESMIRSASDYESNVILTVKLKQLEADNRRYQGRFDESMVLWLEALDLSEKQLDSTAITDTYMGAGVTEFLRGNLDVAAKYVSIYNEFNSRVGNTKKLAYALSIQSLIDYQNSNYQSSIDKSLRSFELRKMLGDLKGQGESLNNLALGQMGLGNWVQALRYLDDAILLKTQANDFTQMTVILNNKGYCYKKLGDVSKAVECFELALEKGKENGQSGDLVTSYQNLISIYVQDKSFEKAFGLQSELMLLKDSLSDLLTRRTVQELEVRMQSGRQQQEIELLQKERSIITNRWLTLALGLFFALILGVLFYDNQKRKYRQEKELLSAEDELQKAELRIMTDLLEHNQQKLSLYTENLLRKNQLVSRLEDKLKEAVEGDGNSGEGKAIMENISSVRILTDHDWEEFKQLFEGVHRGLLDRLLLKYENLTLGEQRLFLLMKLAMSTKEIANILGVSPDSVKKGRYRLKKKLELSDEVLLQDFINDF